LAEEFSRRLIQAELAERKRISRELHDETGQALMLLRLNLDVLSSRLATGTTKSKVIKSVGLLDRIIEDLRRIIARLSPRVLEELGLMAAIRKEARQLTRNTGIKVHLSLPEQPGHTSPETEIAIYRCVQEALHNISKHSQAKNVQVRLQMKADSIRLQVGDDGIGLSGEAKSQSQGLGLIGMRERIAGLGGKVRITSPRQRGTRISVILSVPRRATERDGSSTAATRRNHRPVPAASSRSRRSEDRKARSNHAN
jgi:signal transduction histidine kinase